MITKITGEQPFQVLTNNFSISPSNEGYTLQISADGKQYSNLFSVGAGVTRLVTGVAANSYYRLLGNQSEVSINWMKTCVTEGGGAAGNELIPQESLPATADAGTVVALTNGGVYQYDGSDWALVGDDSKTIVDFDHTTQAERASIYAELKALYDAGSGATINRNYDFFKTVNTWQGLKIDYYSFSADTLVFGKVVSPENLADQVVYEQVMTIDSAGTVNVATNTVGGGSSEDIELPIAAAVNDLKENIEVRLDQQYYKKDEVDNIAARKTEASQVNVQIQDYVNPAIAEINNSIEDKELAASAAINDLNTATVKSSAVKKIWSGTQSEYDTIVEKDPATLYIIKD